MDTEQVLFKLTVADVIDVANQEGLALKLDDETMNKIRKGLEWGLECWHDVMKDAIELSFED